MTISGDIAEGRAVVRFPGTKLLALLSVLVVTPVVLVGGWTTSFAGLIVSENGLTSSATLVAALLVLLGWSPAIAGAVTWVVLRHRGHDRRGAWGGSIAAAALAFAVVPGVLFAFYLLAWAVGSAFFY